MSERKKYTELNSGEKEGKRPYEKPVMKAIALFADQVLGLCGKIGDIGGGECSSGPPDNTDGASS